MAIPTTITSDPRPSARAWLIWSGLLIGTYLAIHFLAWQRTLIGTEVWAHYYAGQPFGLQLDAIHGDLVHVHGRTHLARCFRADRSGGEDAVRMYGLGLLLTVAAMALWEVWTERPRTLMLAAWTLVAVLLVYTHLFGALLLMAFAVTNWVCGPRRWAFSVAACIPALAFLPWLLYVLPVYASRGLADNVWWVPKRLPVVLGVFSYGLLGGGGFLGPAKVRMALAAMTGVVHLALLVFGWRIAR